MGTWPDWIAAVGTWLAFGGFAFGLWWEIRRRRLDDKQAAVDRLDAKMQQARLVFVEKTTTAARDIGVRVHNKSNAPIFAFNVTCFVGEPGSTIRPVGKPRPGNANGVKPVDDVEVFFDLDPSEQEIQLGMLLGIQVDFTDARGSRWRRIDDDQPYLID